MADAPPDAGASTVLRERDGNFGVPSGGASVVEPLPPLDGNVTGAALAVDGVTPVSTSTGAPGLKVVVQSEHPLYRRLRSDTSITTGYGFSADPAAGFALPRVGFSATAEQTYGVQEVAASTTGGFPGASTPSSGTSSSPTASPSLSPSRTRAVLRRPPP